MYYTLLLKTLFIKLLINNITNTIDQLIIIYIHLLFPIKFDYFIFYNFLKLKLKFLTNSPLTGKTGN